MKYHKPAFEINIRARCFCPGVATLFFGTDVSKAALLILLIEIDDFLFHKEKKQHAWEGGFEKNPLIQFVYKLEKIIILNSFS